jgi:hypothetical protein
MKSIKHLLFLALAIILVMSSCSLEKRIYMSDYHIEWTDADRITSPQMILNGSSKKLIEPNQIVEVDKSEITTYDINNSPNVIDYKNTISTGEKSIVSPKMKRNSVQSSLKKIKRDEVKKADYLVKFDFKKDIKKLLNGNEEKPEWNSLAIAGLACVVLGFTLSLLLPFGFYLGLLLIPAGAILSIMGLRQILKGKKGVQEIKDKKSKKRKISKIFAIAGLLLGIALIVLIVCLFVGLLTMSVR